jgi:hypothetical protein
LENGLKIAAALLAAGLTTSSPLRAQSFPSPQYAAGDQNFRLSVTENSCAIEQAGAARRLVLDLRPPCYFAVWRDPPPRIKASGPSPVGGVGDPAAWRYGAKRNMTVVAVIGDPVPDRLCSDPVCRSRARANFHCGASLQAVLLREGRITLSRKRAQAGVFCVETGLDEKEFWLLAHR